MARQCVIVSIGEALLCEYPDRIEPGGLAINCARYANKLGHRGIPVSRIGQDPAAEELLKQLRTLGISPDHLQSDPDLPTGRLTVRSIAGKTTRSLTAWAAFDNLQWDFDLVDVAQQADAVVFGDLARRKGQSQSIIKRFLAECGGAVRVCDLTNRASDAIDRSEARACLEFAEGLIADHTAIKALVPNWKGHDVHAAAVEIISSSSLAFVASIECGDCNEMWTIHNPQQEVRAKQATPSANHDAATVGLLHGVLNGWELAKCLEAMTSQD